MGLPLQAMTVNCVGGGALPFSLLPLVLFQVDRLMELHFKYLGAMQVADKKIEGEKHVCIPACFLQISYTLHMVPCVPSLSAQGR